MIRIVLILLLFIFGCKKNTVHIVDQNGIENWPEMSKESIGERLADRIADHLNTDHD